MKILNISLGFFRGRLLNRPDPVRVTVICYVVYSKAFCQSVRTGQCIGQMLYFAHILTIRLIL